MKSLINITIIFLSLFIGHGCIGQSSDKSDSEIYENEMELNYPWKQQITKIAISAIERSIKNLSLPKQQRDRNFPSDPGPYNVPFTQTKIIEFEIIGYSFSESTADIYHIEFRPQNEICCGNRITVEINIKTNKVFRVYMQADA